MPPKRLAFVGRTGADEAALCAPNIVPGLEGMVLGEAAALLPKGLMLNVWPGVEGAEDALWLNSSSDAGGTGV